MKALTMIAGTWDDQGGRPSKIADLITRGILEAGSFGNEYRIENGGSFHQLKDMLNDDLLAREDQVIVWMANVPNHLPKFRDIKKAFPRAILISSKRNTDKQYQFQDIMAHGLSLKSNLIIEFAKTTGSKEIRGRLLDPLGNQWWPRDTDYASEMVELGVTLAKRADQLLKIRRQGTVRSPEDHDTLPDRLAIDTFIKYVREASDTFSELIRPANGVTRYLGNASFRCESGFPSFREGSSIYVSRRNVDKADIGKDAFVQVGRNRAGQIWYRGEHKPSVDTPIQIALYNLLPEINFMLHSHVYVKGAPFTSEMIPCGGLQEIGEIGRVIGGHNINTYNSFAVNLIGHGSILFLRSQHGFNRYKFYARPKPELIKG